MILAASEDFGMQSQSRSSRTTFRQCLQDNNCLWDREGENLQGSAFLFTPHHALARRILVLFWSWDISCVCFGVASGLVYSSGYSLIKWNMVLGGCGVAVGWGLVGVGGLNCLLVSPVYSPKPEPNWARCCVLQARLHNTAKQGLLIRKDCIVKFCQNPPVFYHPPLFVRRWESYVCCYQQKKILKPIPQSILTFLPYLWHRPKPVGYD